MITEDMLSLFQVSDTGYWELQLLFLFDLNFQLYVNEFFFHLLPFFVDKRGQILWKEHNILCTAYYNVYHITVSSIFCILFLVDC